MAQDRATFVIDRYKKFLDGKASASAKGGGEGFFGSFMKRTGLRVQQFSKKPVESLIYYTLASLPVPMWSEDDAAGITNVLAKRWGSTFEPPRLPSERETQMLKTIAAQYFREFLRADPFARNALLQHYQTKHGEIPMGIHGFVAPRQGEQTNGKVLPFKRAQEAAHSHALLRRLAARRALHPSSLPSFRRPLQRRTA